MDLSIHFNSRIGTYVLICHDIFAYIRGRRMDNDRINGRIYLYAFIMVIEALTKTAEDEIISLNAKKTVAFADSERVKRLTESVFQLNHIRDEIQRELGLIK